MVSHRRDAAAPTDAAGARILVVEARFYDDIADALLDGARTALSAAGAEATVVTVPGALEAPPTVAILVEAAREAGRPYDAAVVLGCVIRGETGHYDIVAGESSRALMDLSVTLRLPLGNGILTVETREQALARARVSEMNKGGGAAEAALAVLALKRGGGGVRAMSQRNERRGARLSVVQALYEMEISGKGVIEALAEFEAHWIGREVDGIHHPPAEIGFFRDVLRGSVDEQRAIDPRLDQALTKGWPLKRVEAVLRAILRAGAYELMFRRDVPARSAISEYVDVAHSFYDGDEPGLVNAVLDRVAREVRADELTPAAGGQG